MILRGISINKDKMSLVFLLLILGLAFALRTASAVVVTQHIANRGTSAFLIAGDADGYWELATKIVRNEPYAIHQPPRYILRMPGFPVVLAVVIAIFGENSYWAARLLLGGFGSIACAMVYWLGVRIGRPKEGFIAGLLAAVSPAFIGFSVLILTETVFAIGLLGTLIAFTALFPYGVNQENRKFKMPDAVSAFTVGVVVAAACYLKPSWVLVLPVIIVLTMWQLRQQFAIGVSCSALMLLGFVLLLSPWMVRNTQITGHFVPLTLWMGPSLYDGVNPEANGKSNMQFFDRDRLMTSMSEYDVDQHYKAKSIRYMQENPARTLQLAFIKLGLFFKPWPDAEQLNSRILKMGLGVFTIPVLLLAVVGAWQVRNDFYLLLLLLGPMLYFAAIHCLFVSSLRYRIPAEYPALLLSVMGGFGVLRQFQAWGKLQPQADSLSQVETKE